MATNVKLAAIARLVVEKFLGRATAAAAARERWKAPVKAAAPNALICVRVKTIPAFHHLKF